MSCVRRNGTGAGLIGIMVLALFVAGCATPLPTQTQVRVPTPIRGNSGQYMCPFTSDDTVAEWVSTGVKARFGSAVGSAIGARAGQEILKNIPIIGGILGQEVGKAAGRRIAISSSGGMEKIKSTSDLSFNSIDDMAVYMYAKHSGRKDYKQVLQLTQEIYPKLQGRYIRAIRAARIQ